MTYTIVNRTDLERAAQTGTATFEGYRYGDMSLSFFWVDLPPGGAARLHRHPCEEIFIIQEGHVTFTVGTAIVAASAGQIVIVPPGVPHAFRNSGDGPLRQIDILPSKHIVTE